MKMGREDDAGKFSNVMLMSESGGDTEVGVITPKDTTPGFKISYQTAVALLVVCLALAVVPGVIVHFLHPCPHQGTIAENNVTGRRKTELQYEQCRELSENLVKCLKEASHSSNKNTTNTTAPHQAWNPEQSEDQTTINYRLPNTLVPIHYNIQLKPNIYQDDPADFGLEGFSEVILKCAIPTDLVVIHLLDLLIKHIEIESEPPSIFIVNKTEDKATQFLNISLSRALRVGERVKLGFAYKGNLENKIHGLHYRSYKENNQTRFMVASLLAPTFARSVFPCMDEPHLKATFNVTLLYKHPMVALSNMPNFTRHDREDGWVSENYTKTPLMSTYLLAFIIAPYDYIEDTTAGGLHPKHMRYWASQTAVSAGHLSYARSVDGKLFDYYETYFNESYIFPKQDSVAVPGHKGGAMENWGLITYRESRLLFDPLYTSAQIQQAMTATQAHELVHMWLGNIVTCKWWDDTWLQEGFARYFQHYGQRHVQRMWDVEEIFMLQVFPRVLLSDSQGYQQEVSHRVHTTLDASSIFGTITYDKGATLIRMMQKFLGEETFHDAIRAYIKKYAYSTATTYDLLEVMTQKANRDGTDLGGSNVTNVMLPWLKQVGYPLVTVSRTAGSLAFEVTQSIYLQNPEKPVDDFSKADYGYSWSIPLTYQTSQNANTQQVWFHRRNGTITWQGDWSEGDWMLANIDRAGLYRVNYDMNNWRALQAQLLEDHNIIPYINRAQLIDDAFSLSRSGRLDIVTAMSLTEYMTKETGYLPFFVLMKNIGGLNKLLHNSDIYGALRVYMRQLLIPVYNTVGWDAKSTDVLSDIYKRTDVLKMACDFGYGPCAEEARKRFQMFKRNPQDKTIIRPDIRQVVYCFGARYGSEDDWEFLLDQYSKETNLAELWMMRTSITCVQNPWQLNKLFHMTMDKNSSTIPDKDRLALRVDILRNSIMVPYMWRYLTIDVHKEPDNDHSEPLFYMMLDALSHYITSEDELQTLEDSISNSEKYKPSLETFRPMIERNIKIYNANYESIKQWLAAFNSR